MTDKNKALRGVIAEINSRNDARDNLPHQFFKHYTTAAIETEIEQRNGDIGVLLGAVDILFSEVDRLRGQDQALKAKCWDMTKGWHTERQIARVVANAELHLRGGPDREVPDDEVPTPEVIRDLFAAAAPIGTPCRYYPVLPALDPDAPFEKSTIRSAPWVTGSGQVIVSIEGYAGGKDIRHVAFDVGTGS